MKEFIREKHTTKRFHGAVCGVLVLLMAVLLLAFLVSNWHSGHDLRYHFNAIRSLSVAWDRGSFGGKLMELIGCDYGYGTGLFYSTIPASLCVVLMKIFHLPMIFALYLELLLMMSGGAITLYFFLNRVFRDGRVAAFGALTYSIYPYFLWDVYHRFAFTEVFLMLALPMVAWSVYELLHRDNARAFVPLFIVGYALSIFSHFTMSVYLTVFIGIWLLFYHEKTFRKKTLLYFAVATVSVLFITASYYIPMIFNYGVSATSGMGVSARSLFFRSFKSYKFGFLILNTVFLYCTFILYTVFYVRERKKICGNMRGISKAEKQERKKAFPKEMTLVFILAALTVWISSPIFPWIVLPSFMGMIQYPFRISLLGSVISVFEICYIFRGLLAKKPEKFDEDVVSENSENEGVWFEGKKRFWKIGLLTCLTVCAVTCCVMPWFILRRVGSTTYRDSVLSETTGFSDCQGLGSGKNGDYYPKNCTYEYSTTRLCDGFVTETSDGVYVYELSDYSGLSQVYFLASGNGYAVLEIPYALTENVAIYRYEEKGTNQPLAVTAESYDGGEKTKIVFPGYDQSSKIILSYKNAPDFKAYLQENAFGVLTLEGDVSATNLKKEYVGKYSLDVTAGEEGGVLELPSYYYKGYTLTLEKADGMVVSVTPVHGRNGFVEVNVTESGTLYVEYTSEGFAFAYKLTAVGVICAVGLCVTSCIVQMKKKKE